VLARRCSDAGARGAGAAAAPAALAEDSLAVAREHAEDAWVVRREVAVELRAQLTPGGGVAAAAGMRW
jgi:hypothetical protein